MYAKLTIDENNVKMFRSSTKFCIIVYFPILKVARELVEMETYVRFCFLSHKHISEKQIIFVVGSSRL